MAFRIAPTRMKIATPLGVRFINLPRTVVDVAFHRLPPDKNGVRETTRVSIYLHRYTDTGRSYRGKVGPREMARAARRLARLDTREAA